MKGPSTTCVSALWKAKSSRALPKARKRYGAESLHLLAHPTVSDILASQRFDPRSCRDT